MLAKEVDRWNWYNKKSNHPALDIEALPVVKVFLIELLYKSYGKLMKPTLKVELDLQTKAIQLDEAPEAVEFDPFA